MNTLSCGIVGLPNVGKSTLFNALLKKIQADAANFPFCTIKPNIGIVNVPDKRLHILATFSKSQKIIPATMTFVDIAGLVQGASNGEGLGNAFLANIRETDAIIHVIRCFENEEIIHVEGNINPIRDIEVIQLELILSDLQIADNSLQKIQRQSKGNKAMIPTLNTLQKVHDHLNKNLPLSSLFLTKEEQAILKPYHFITSKKIIYAANLCEQDLLTLDNPHLKVVEDYAHQYNSPVIPFCAKLEEDLAQLSAQEAQDYLSTFGVKESSLNRLIKISYQSLHLITFLTTGKEETHAWTIPKGATAPEAAGKIHTDFQKGFIRAEVIPFEAMVKYSNRLAAKEGGVARLEGKEYIVQDGDIIVFFHNR